MAQTQWARLEYQVSLKLSVSRNFCSQPCILIRNSKSQVRLRRLPIAGFSKLQVWWATEIVGPSYRWIPCGDREVPPQPWPWPEPPQWVDSQHSALQDDRELNFIWNTIIQEKLSPLTSRVLEKSHKWEVSIQLISINYVKLALDTARPHIHKLFTLSILIRLGLRYVTACASNKVSHAVSNIVYTGSDSLRQAHLDSIWINYCISTEVLWVWI